MLVARRVRVDDIGLIHADDLVAGRLIYIPVVGGLDDDVVAVLDVLQLSEVAPCGVAGETAVAGAAGHDGVRVVACAEIVEDLFADAFL